MRFISRINGRVLQCLKDDLLRPDGPIVYDKKLEGQTCVGNQYVVGPVAGPAADVDNVIHEICHFGEREIDKLLLYPTTSWGFTYGKYWQIGTQDGWEQSTDQSVKREQRVFAYQLSLSRHYDIAKHPFHLCKSIRWLGAWCYYQPFPIDTHDDDPRIIHLAAEAEQMSRNEFTYEAFMDAFNLRVDRLRNLTNTNGLVTV